MPFKLNHDRSRHISRQKHRVTNSKAYDAALRQRGSLTVWFADEAIAGWRAALRITPSGRPWYSPLAIMTALTLRAVFRLMLRQTEGLIGSIIGLLGLVLAVPDPSTLSRRAATLQVPRPQPRRSWRTLHIGRDAYTGQIVAAVLTRKEVDDGALEQPRPRSGTTTCSSSPSTAEQPGRRHPATPSAPGLRRPSAGSSK